MATSISPPAKSTSCIEAETRTSMSGWMALNRSSRGSSHLLANDGATLTVRTPLRPATLMLSMAVERPSNAARMPGRQAAPASVSTS